ncbi:MAG: hypothetical protein ACLQOO_20645, partial [Terriglobia bacterium]
MRSRSTDSPGDSRKHLRGRPVCPLCLTVLISIFLWAPARPRAEAAMNDAPVRYLPDLKVWVLSTDRT